MLARTLGLIALSVAGAGWARAPMRGAEASPRMHLVAIKGFAFTPVKTTVALGDTISWANEDIVIHTITADTARWDSGDLTTGKRFRMVAAKRGTLAYHCELHPNMKGTLVVR